MVCDSYSLTDAVFPLTCFSFPLLWGKNEGDRHQEKSRDLETSTVPEPMRANLVRASHIQHTMPVWKEAIMPAPLNPKAIVDIKYWELHMTDGAIGFVTLGHRKELRLTGIVSTGELGPEWVWD